MYATLKIAAVAVLVLAVGVAIGTFLPNSPNTAAGPSASPVASPTATPPPIPYSFLGPLDAGTYTLGSPSGSDTLLDRMTATVPEGWQGVGANGSRTSSTPRPPAPT